MATTPSRMFQTVTATPARLLAATMSVLLVATSAVLLSTPQAKVGASVTESGDGVVFDPSTATLTGRDETSETYTDAAGVSQTTLSLFPAHVERDGQWIPASAGVESAKGGGWVATNHALEVELAENAADDGAVALTRDGFRVTSQLVGATSSEGKVESSSTESSVLVYDGAAAGSDLQYVLTPHSVKENVILERVPEAAPEYTWRLDVGALAVEQGPSGETLLKDPTGTVVITIPPPLMWDSSGREGEREAAIVNVDLALSEVADGVYEYTLSPDLGWLSDSEREYPVFVDPTFSAGVAGANAYKSDGVVAGGLIKVGSPNQANTSWRGVAYYNYSSLWGKRVTGAHLYASRRLGTVNCYQGELQWAAAWAYSPLGTSLSAFTVCNGSGDAESQTMTDYFSYWVNQQHLAALMMRGYECGSCYSYKDLNTSLTIWWVERHTIGAVGGPKNDETRVVTPLMSADGVVNSGGTQYFRYVFTSDNGGSAFTSPWVPKGNYRVPDGALTPGKHYTYKVESQDSLPQSPTVTKTDSTWKFWTDTAPAAPTNVTVDGQALTTTGIETSVRPTLAATVSDPDGGQIQALFTVKQDGVVIMDSVPGSLVTVTTTGTGVSSVALPYAISKGATYTVEVVAFDGHMASSSVTPTGDFTGPTRTLREIPGNDDDETGAA